MHWRMIKAVLILPGTALVLVPALTLWAAAGGPWAHAWAGPTDARLWAGLVLAAAGVFFGAWTASLFVAVGQGTPAPWDPPRKLVVRGPYRHVRNPMITSIVTALAAEALIAGSWPVAGWAAVFLVANGLYFPLVEEKALERRFGDDYRTYKANVPRWLPRLTPWRWPE